MVFFALFLFEIVFLFFISRELTKLLSQKITVRQLAIIFFPGVVVHELAHLLVANILFVKTGEIEFVPQITKQGVRLGSVVIAKTDPVRRALIGFAPVLVGLLLVIGIVYSFIQSSMLVKFIALYSLFVISNTMFSSKKDMEGALELLIVMALLGLLMYYFGVRFDASIIQNFLFSQELIIQKAAILLSLPIVIDLGILGTIKIFT